MFVRVVAASAYIHVPYYAYFIPTSPYITLLIIYERDTTLQKATALISSWLVHDLSIIIGLFYACSVVHSG